MKRITKDGLPLINAVEVRRKMDEFGIAIERDTTDSALLLSTSIMYIRHKFLCPFMDERIVQYMNWLEGK